jgi:hypothetical protein
VVKHIRLFSSNREAAAPLIDKLRAAGYAVSLHPRTQAPSLREIKESAPAAVVIDLSRMPSHGRAIGAWLRGSKSTRHIPLVFVDGDLAKVAALRREIPDAVYHRSPASATRSRRPSRILRLNSWSRAR